MADEPKNTPEAEAAPEDSRPEWLPEKYESPEQLAQAYKSAESKIREQGESLSAIQSELEQYREAFSAQQAEQQRAQQPDPYEMYEQDPLAATQTLIRQELAPLMQAVQQQQAQAYQPLYQSQNEQLAYIANETAAKKYEDWDEIGPRVRDAMLENPILFPKEAMQSLESVVAAVDNAYRFVKYEDLNKNVQDLSAQQAETARAMKLGAQTATGSAGRPDSPEENKQFLDDLKAAHKPTRLSKGW